MEGCPTPAMSSQAALPPLTPALPPLCCKGPELYSICSCMGRVACTQESAPAQPTAHSSVHRAHVLLAVTTFYPQQIPRGSTSIAALCLFTYRCGVTKTGTCSHGISEFKVVQMFLPITCTAVGVSPNAQDTCLEHFSQGKDPEALPLFGGVGDEPGKGRIMVRPAGVPLSSVPDTPSF